MGISIETALAITSGMKALGELVTGRSQQQAYNLQANLARQQAALEAVYAERDAAETRQAAAESAAKTRSQARRVKAQAAARYAKSGVVAGAGSPVAIDEYILSAGESDAIAQITTGERRARSIQEQAAVGRYSAGQQAALLEMAGSQAMSTAWFGAGRSVLSGFIRSKQGWLTE